MNRPPAPPPGPDDPAAGGCPVHHGAGLPTRDTTAPEATDNGSTGTPAHHDTPAAGNAPAIHDTSAIHDTPAGYDTPAAPKAAPSEVPGPVDGREPMYTEEFATDPHAAYRRWRTRYGPLVPVWLSPATPHSPPVAATLVIGYRQAIAILNDPDRFPADPRAWQQDVPEACPVKPMLEWRPNALRSAGMDHARYRSATVDALDATDLHRLRDIVETIAHQAIDAFRDEETVDLHTRFMWVVAFEALNWLHGCPTSVGQRIADGMASIFEGVDAEQGNTLIAGAVTELAGLKIAQPGPDLVSRLLSHTTALTPMEIGQQIVTLYGAGIEPLTNLMTNTARILLTDDGFSGTLHSGTLTVREALDHILYRDPPLASYCMSYPPYPADLDGVQLPAHQPIMIGMAACNDDMADGQSAERLIGNRAHLAWGTGPHACPAQPHARIIAETALGVLLDQIPEMDLAVPETQLAWRPGPFHRALHTLPITHPTRAAHPRQGSHPRTDLHALPQPGTGDSL